jgi:hypothetical protein
MEQLIKTFYTAFQQRDWKTMQSCYHDDVVFSDPVFKYLQGNQAKAMWHMLVTAGKDLEIKFGKVKADDKKGSCRWEAFYSFSRTGNKVHNIIDAKFEFKDGKIYAHLDSFNLWRWSSMALGIGGTLLGWSPLVKGRVRRIARSNLKKFMEANGY